jgi:hypothetical protein
LNTVAISATKISATDDIRDVDPSKRNCLLSDENQDMKIHKKYSQSNCLLECSLSYAQKELAKSKNLTKPCSPWFFPTSEQFATICDPWETTDFGAFFNNVPDTECSKCLPDCNTVTYEPAVTAVPFRRCDFRNLGVTPLCNLEGYNLPEPWIWTRQLLKNLKIEGKTNSSSIKGFNVVASERSLFSSLQQPSIFNLANESYDAYDKDIALVQFYFKSSSVLQFETRQSQGWIDFFSSIGGLLGLCIGISIVTFIELFWLLFTLIIKLLQPN